MRRTKSCTAKRVAGRSHSHSHVLHCFLTTFRYRSTPRIHLVVDALEVIGELGDNDIGITSLSRGVVLIPTSVYVVVDLDLECPRTSATRMAWLVGMTNTPLSPLRPITSSESARTAMNLKPWSVMPLAVGAN